MSKGEAPLQRKLTEKERDLVAEHLWVAAAIAGKYRWLAPKIADGDVEAAARDGLMNAAPLFDPSRGGSFASYAYWFVVRSILAAAEARAPVLVAGARAALDAAEEGRDGPLEEAPEDLAEALEPVLAARCIGAATLCYARRAGALSERQERAVRLIDELLSGFADLERAIVIRHYGEGVAWAVIAAEVGKRAATVKRWGQKLRAVLEERLLARGANPFRQGEGKDGAGGGARE
jgi:RNA polymerase sigma factor (sigma-70 family)